MMSLESQNLGDSCPAMHPPPLPHQVSSLPAYRKYHANIFMSQSKEPQGFHQMQICLYSSKTRNVRYHTCSVACLRSYNILI